MYKNEDIIKIKSINSKDDICAVDWVLTYWCNYRCPYCIQYSRDKDSFIKESVLYTRATNLNLYLKQNNINNVILKLIGGEVTYYNLINIIDRIESVREVRLITNFSQKLEYFQDLYNFLYSKNIRITLVCSRHPQNINFDAKFIELTEWCRINNYKDPQVSMVVDNNFDFKIVDNFIESAVFNVKLVKYKDHGANNRELSKEVEAKINFYNQLQRKIAKPDIEVEFKDKTKEQFINSVDFTNNLDENGFISDNFYCDALSKSTLYIDEQGNIRPFKCKFLRENDDYIYGNLDDISSFKTLPDSKFIKCNLTSLNKNFRCTICNGNNVYRYKEDSINKLNYINITNNKLFELKWRLTNWCNYKCSYCCNNIDNKCWISEDLLVKRAKKVNNYLKRKNKPVGLELLGGEVTYYNLPRILNEIDNLEYLVITTNFSNNIDYFKNLYNYCDNRTIFLSLIVSYHETGDEFFNKVFELTNWCKANSYPLPSVVFVVDNTFDITIIDRFPFLSQLELNFCPKILKTGGIAQLNPTLATRLAQIDKLKKIEYLPKLANIVPEWIFNIDGRELKLRPDQFLRSYTKDNMLSTANLYCDAGINSLMIYADGSIRRCDCCDKKTIGSIDDNNIWLKLDSSKCTNKFCMLSQHVNIYNDIEYDPFAGELAKLNQ